ncbi:MAG: GGDEF domain-containing protein [Defluviitaleaceae bacterium]|nr:GGDEF domain-containing protein [Defluviitaleaceae bacterium]
MASLFCKRIFGQYNKIEKYNKKIIYTFIVICYMGIMASAIHLGVFAVPNEPSIVFSIFLTSFLISITLPPTHSLLLMLVAVIVFSVSVIVFKDRFLWTLDLLNLAISIPISTAYSWHISQYRLLAALNASKLEEERNRFHTQSTIDDLTQLKNRRDFDNKFGRYLSDCREKDDFICLAIADIDHFKTYNDHYGHLGGDECLRAIGAALLEPWDNRSVYVARIGGEEFALLWFEEEKNNIQNTVLQLQKRVSGLKIPHKKSTVSEYVSLSIGVCVVRSKKEGNSQDAIYSLADKALYEAKKDGRNRIVIFDGELKY